MNADTNVDVTQVRAVTRKKERYAMLNELDPQVKALLERFQANAARHPAPATPLSQKEKIMATREMFNAYAALRYPSESVSRTEDFVIRGPAGKISVRLYVPHTIMLSSVKGIREDLLPQKALSCCRVFAQRQ